jgi:hypothetical protein
MRLCGDNKQASNKLAFRKDWDVIPPGKLTAQGLAQRLASLSVAAALVACTSTPPPGLPVAVLPGTGKDLAAFQQDELICQQHAMAHTGYGSTTGSVVTGSQAGTAGNPANGVSRNATAGAPPFAAPTAANAAVPAEAQPFDATGYLQCMASRGDTVQPRPAQNAVADPYGAYYAYGYPYGYLYDYPYGFYDPGFVGAFGFVGRFHHGFDHRAFAHGGFQHHGFAHAGGFGHGGGGHR